jgi:hypothetical protein
MCVRNGVLCWAQQLLIEMLSLSRERRKKRERLRQMRRATFSKL